MDDYFLSETAKRIKIINNDNDLSQEKKRMSNNIDLVYKWASNINNDAISAVNIIQSDKFDEKLIPIVTRFLGEIIGATEAIMTATKPQN